MRTFIFCVIWIASVSSLFAQESAPNFIVILTDDQGWGTTSFEYDPEIPESRSDFFETPNIERLIESGIRFTQAYSAHPNCSPSRASLLTGRSPAALKFTDICGRSSGPLYEGNRLIPPDHVNDLAADEMTIPELLKRHQPRYRAAHFGKWHLRGGGPRNHGFDASDGSTSNAEGSRQSNLPDDPKRCFSIARSSIDWMNEQVANDRPFYLQVSHYATHLGYQAREETIQRFRDREPGTRHQNVAYASMMAEMDESIGMLLDAVESAGIAESTFIIFTADNGTYPTDDRSNINGPLRGSKATLWEAGVRVPFVVTGPNIPAGSFSRSPVIGYDILPTICELAGIDSWPDVVEGASLVPELTQTERVQRTNEFFVFHWPHYQHEKRSKPDTTILRGHYKLHYWWEDESVMLFDLSDDLAEQVDLSATMPELTEQMRRELMSYLRDIDAQRPSVNREYNPSTDPARRIRSSR